MNLRDQIRSTLSALQARAISSGYDREAAVLVPVFEIDQEPSASGSMKRTQCGQKSLTNSGICLCCGGRLTNKVVSIKPIGHIYL